MIKNWIIVFILLFCQSAFSQNRTAAADSLCWDERMKLKWSDFRGKPDTTAVTYMGTKGH